MAAPHRKRGSSQPDFRELFFQYFESRTGRLRYTIRHDSNLRHDVAFLSGLLHDAMIETDSVRLRNHRLVIPLERTKWELRTTNEAGLRSLDECRSKLAITPAHQWTRINESQSLANSENLMLSGVECRGLYADDDDLIFSLVGDKWSWEFRLPRYEFDIELIDTDG